MTIQKSERHQKIIGQYGEHFVCNRLSTSGFDVMRVDHVGIDILAFRQDGLRLGISVKSRTRHRKEREDATVNLFLATEDKLERVCKRLQVKPWIAVYVETETCADLFMTSLDNYRKKYDRSTKLMTWGMKKKHKDGYGEDAAVLHCHVEFTVNRWFENLKDET